MDELAAVVALALDGRRGWWTPRRWGGRVAYYGVDKRPGRPIVLLHDLGLTSTACEVRPLFEAFRWRRPTYAVDWPGFGASERPSHAYGFSVLSGVLADCVRELPGAKAGVDVVALGRGAEPAALLARDEPGLVRSLVVLEPGGLLSFHASLIQVALARFARSCGAGAVRALYAACTTRALVVRAASTRFHGAPDPCLVELAHASGRVAGGQHAALAFAWSGRGSDATGTLDSLSIPVLVVHDARGHGAVALEAFLRRRPNRQAVRITPSRGMPHFERRGDTVEALDRFWQSLPSVARDRAMR